MHSSREEFILGEVVIQKTLSGSWHRGFSSLTVRVTPNYLSKYFTTSFCSESSWVNTAKRGDNSGRCALSTTSTHIASTSSSSGA